MCKTMAPLLCGQIKNDTKRWDMVIEGLKSGGNASPHLAINKEQKKLPTSKQKSFENVPLNVHSVLLPPSIHTR